ncbi:MAG TPA: hypothetical protein VMN81_05025 [Vicinamibacterales bacterium]|nr:hypothetical protein [Vicinamibacterales bacterium]
MVLSDELRIALRPREAYARLEASPGYLLFYIPFLSLLIAACASVSATGRVTLALLASLSVSWMFVPVLHVLLAAALVLSAPARRVSGMRATSLLLMGHAPWSLWLVAAALMTAGGGYALYHEALLLALVPIALTARLVHAFCLEVLGASARGALARVFAHQAATWGVAAIYLDRAVGLLPRLQGLFA